VSLTQLEYVLGHNPQTEVTAMVELDINHSSTMVTAKLDLAENKNKIIITS
jgi:hypothetical protein